jgi:hypothetical protein
VNFNTHSEIEEGSHAFLSPSAYHWLRYDTHKLTHKYEKYLASQRGTKLHALANQLIEMGIMVEKTNATFNAYVNDAIRFGMKSEQPLKYSNNCFGTADAISYNKYKSKNKWLLRIHDLKTGETPASMDQLEIYAALFFLEYGRIASIDNSLIELRIYQNDAVKVHTPDISKIKEVMEIIVFADDHVEGLKEIYYE